MPKLISSRMAHKIIAALYAGIPVDEVKNDLLMGWTNDEKIRCGV